MILKKFDQNTARLIPNMIKMESELELSTYTIYEWDLVHFEEGKSVKCKGHGRVMFFLQMMTIKVYTVNMILQNETVFKDHTDNIIKILLFKDKL